MTVHLVGAGPGDPLLLTKRAARLLGEADVVVADRRSSDAVVALARQGAEVVHVGRADGHDAWGIDAIVDLLAAHHEAGRTVVRLKAGDPFVCSRGAEEVDALAERGIAVEVTPGVTAATAAPLVAGVPRGRTVTIASGDDDPLAPPVDWAAHADPEGSLVVLTGRAHQRSIAEALLAAGLPGATSTSVVHGATRPSQQVVRTTLDQLGATRLPPPAAFVVGPMACPDDGGDDGAHP